MGSVDRKWHDEPVTSELQTHSRIYQIVNYHHSLNKPMLCDAKYVETQPLKF